MTRILTPEFQFTAKGGVSTALRSGPMDTRTTIDLPVVFPRTALFLHGYQVNLGGDLVAEMHPQWALLADMDLLLLPSSKESFALHHKGLLMWRRSNRLQLLFGYLLVYGIYPFGAQWHLLPLIDLQWARHRNAERGG
ncbi:MAG: hypothetical protein V3U35_05595 [Candidatus Neomarinimicrobiota bacterium]